MSGAAGGGGTDRPERRPGDGAGPDGGGGGADGAPARQPPATLLVGTLGLLAVVAGLAIVLVYEWANPRIEAHRARELRVAIQEVLGAPESYETRWLRDGELLDSLPAGADSASAVPVYAGFDAGGDLVGYALAGEKAGYQDVIRLIFGYDPGSDQVVGMKVLESKETPGLGAKITSDSTFLDEFRGVATPLRGVKDGGDGTGEVDMITGATISSEAVIEIINERLDVLAPALRGGPGVTVLGSGTRSGASRSSNAAPGRTGASGVRVPAGGEGRAP